MSKIGREFDFVKTKFRVISDSKEEKFIVEHNHMGGRSDDWYEEKDKNGNTIVFSTLEEAREYKQKRENEAKEIWRIIE